MSTIVNKGGFDFLCKTPTGKTISCFMDSNEPVEANFNKLEVNYNGVVRVLVSRKKIITEKGEEKIIDKNEYVSVGRLKPRSDKDAANFANAKHETEIVSQKRRTELKVQQKNNKRKKEA